MLNKQFECFLAVAKRRNFSRAAKDLYLSPSAVTQQIGALEQALGFRLFNRDNRGASLTEAGKSFYESIRHIDALTAEAVLRAREIAGIASRSLIIGFPVMGEPLLTTCAVYAERSRLHGSIRLVRNCAVEAVAEGSISMCLNFYSPQLLTPNLRHEVLYYSYPQLIMSTGHPLAVLDRIPLSKLDGETLSMPPPGHIPHHDKLRELLKAHFPALRFEDSSNDEEAYLSAILNGILCMNSQLSPKPMEHTCIRPILPEDWFPPFCTCIYYREEENPLLAEFIQIMHEATWEILDEERRELLIKYGES